MTPGERAWLERTIAQWGEQVAVMHRIACTRQSMLNRAGALAEVVASLQARLDAAPAPIAAPVVRTVSRARQHHLDEMAAYRARRAAGEAVQPLARRNLFAEWAALARGEPVRVASASPTALPITPPPIAKPFVAGPQLSFAL